MSTRLWQWSSSSPTVYSQAWALCLLSFALCSIWYSERRCELQCQLAMLITIACASILFYTQKIIANFVVIAPVWKDSSKFHKMTYLHHKHDWEIHYYTCTCVCHLFIHKEQMMYSVTIHTYKAVTPPC